jgi:hypothetical protein
MTVNFIKIFRILCRLFIFMLLLSLLVAHNNTASSQGAHNWSPQQRVPGYAGDTLPPYLVADQNRTVHAFTSQWVGEDNPQLAVVYNQWTLEGGWTPVVDIILSPMEQARVMGAFLDKDGMMHLIFFGGDDRFANIYYTRAPALEAGRATAWEEPQVIGRDAITPSTASLAGDGNGNLIVLFSGKFSGMGVYSIYSNDTGITWSETLPIYLTNTDGLWPYGIQTYLGQSGWLHVVWSVANVIGHNQSGHYARLDTKIWEWDEPIEFEQGIGIERGMGIANPNVVEHEDKVLIMYNNGIPPDGVPPAQWLIISSDYGTTWTTPIRAFPTHVGRNGTVSFAVDSKHVLHVLFGQRIPTGNIGAIHGMWHSEFKGDRWGIPIEVVSSSQTRTGSSEGFDPYDARAVISQGNILLVTWRTDPGIVRNGVWFSYREIDSSELPIQKLPGSMVYPNSTPQEGLDENHQETMQPDGGDEIETNLFWDDRQEPILQNSLSTVVIISTIPVAVMIIVIYLSRLKK